MSDSVLKRIAPVLIGIAITIVFMVGLAYLARSRRAAGSATPPQLQLIMPRGNAVVDSPLVIRFVSTEPLALQPGGWGARNLHIHARINDIEHMPAAGDIAVADSGYLWTLASAAKGQAVLEIGWADHAHRELAAGKSDVVTVTIR